MAVPSVSATVTIRCSVFRWLLYTDLHCVCLSKHVRNCLGADLFSTICLDVSTFCFNTASLRLHKKLYSYRKFSHLQWYYELAKLLKMILVAIFKKHHTNMLIIYWHPQHTQTPLPPSSLTHYPYTIIGPAFLPLLKWRHL